MATSINSVGASTAKGLSGLVSGMDTESMVEKLLKGTQTKIDSQKAKKQQLLWKQELYRDAISSVKNLKDTYFDFLNPKTNISSNAFFQSMTSTVNSDFLSVVATTNAQTGKFTVKSISQIATSAKFKSANEVTSEIKLNINEAKYNELKTNGKSPVIKVNIDGIEREITLKAEDSSGSFSEATLITNLKNDLQGTGLTISNTLSSYIIEGGTRQVTVYADDQNYLDVLGVKSGTSNQIRFNMSIKDINFRTDLQGSQYSFKINDVEFSFNENETIGSVIDKINSSNAGVEIKYSSVEDKFVISSKETGSGHKINIVQGTGNLMTAMFGDDAAKQIMSGPIDVYGGEYKSVVPDTSATYNLISKQGGTLQINVNGKDYSLTLSAKSSNESDYTKEEIVTKLNEQLKTYFGTEADGKTAKMSFELAGNDLTLKYEQGTAVRFYEGKSETEVSSLLGLKNIDVTADNVKLTGLGFKSGDTITVNVSGADETITINNTTSLKDLIDKVGADKLTYDEKTKTLIVKGDTTKISSSNNAAMNNLFGTSNIDFTATNGTDISSSVVQGENAKFIVITDDGTEVSMEKNTNNFTIDGLSITLKKATTAADKPIEITTTRDTEQILDGIVKFVDDYNKVLEKLNKMVSEDPNYKKYAPLTDKQKDELSDNEVKLWEEKSKEGLLRGDSIISDLISEMRSILYTKPGDAKFALYDIGIKTSANYKDNGKLMIDEATLRDNIANNAGELQKLFASDDGIAKQFSNVLDKYVKSSVTTPGRLVERAGIKSGFSENKNSISREIEDIEKGLKNLEYRYEIERNRYWKQFNSMEQLIQQMNSQSSWLAKQFS